MGNAFDAILVLAAALGCYRLCVQPVKGWSPAVSPILSSVRRLGRRCGSCGQRRANGQRAGLVISADDIPADSAVFPSRLFGIA